MLTDLAFGLAERGSAVTVIASRLRYDGPNALLPPHETKNGVQIERIWTSRFGRAGLALRAVDYLTFHLSAGWALARMARRGDIIIAMTDPPALSILAAIVAWMRGANVVNWLQDIFPEVAEALHVGGRLSSRLFAPIRFLRDVSLRCADMNVAIGTLMASRLLRLGVKPEHICVLPNWADTDAIEPVPAAKNHLRDDWSLFGKFVVAYSGNLGRAHDIETLLRAIALTASRPNDEPEIQWLFIGGGIQYEQLKLETAKLGSDAIAFRPYQPRESLSESLSVADVHIVSLKPELEGLIVPSKFYGIAAAGRPTLFIGSPSGEIARLLARHGCGATIAPGDTAAFVKILSTMARNPHLCRRMGERARAMCETEFSKNRAIASWHELFERLLSNRKQIAGDFDPDRPVEKIQQDDETIVLG